MKLRPASFVLAALTALSAIVPSLAHAQDADASQQTAPEHGRGFRHHGHDGAGRGFGQHGPRTPPVAVRADGTVTRYVVGPTGRVHGALLSDGTMVMLGRDGDQVAARIPVGQRLVAQGFAPQGAAGTLMHATVSDASGAVLTTPRMGGRHHGMGHGGPQGAAPQDPSAQGAAPQGREAWRAMAPAERAQRRAAFMQRHTQRRAQMQARVQALPVVSAAGTVERVLAGPRGMTRALVLSDGTTVYLRGAMAHEVTQRGVAAGQALRASGHGGAYAQGGAVVADQLTLADGTMLTAPPSVQQ